MLTRFESRHRHGEMECIRGTDVDGVDGGAGGSCDFESEFYSQTCPNFGGNCVITPRRIEAIEQCGRLLYRTRVILRLGRCDRQPGPPPGVRGESRGQLQERGGRRGAAARAGPVSRPLQLSGDLVVREDGRVGQVPRAAVTVVLGISRARESSVGLAAVRRRGRPVDRRPHERMTEPDLVGDADQPVRLGGGDILIQAEPKRVSSAPENVRITGGIRRDQQQPLLRRRRERP